MVVVSYSGKEINAKLVYYGPGLSGKTTNLEHIYQSVPQNSRGKMVSMKTRTERTLFFDFLPVDLGQLGGFKTRFLLYTVPGQVYYNATRKLVLRGVDALVFVADSQRGKMKENIESLQNLRDNLKDYDLDLDAMPWVIQYNKRDMDDLYSIEELEAELNPQGVPHFEAVAMNGDGVFETFRGIGKVVLQKLSKEVKLDSGRKPAARPQPQAPAGTAPAPQAQAPAPAPQAPAAPAASSDNELRIESTPSATPEATPRPAAVPEPKPVAEAPAAKAEPAPAASSKKERRRKKKSYTPSSEPAGAASFSEEPEWMRGKPAQPETPAPAEPMSAADSGEGSLDVASSYSGERKDPPAGSGASERKSGFWGRIFGRRKEDEQPVEATPGSRPEPAAESAPEPKTRPEPTTTRVEIPAQGDSEQGPVFLEKRVTVPITLSPEDVARGATLRLVLEIQVETAEGETSKAA